MKDACGNEIELGDRLRVPGRLTKDYKALAFRKGMVKILSWTCRMGETTEIWVEPETIISWDKRAKAIG